MTRLMKPQRQTLSQNQKQSQEQKQRQTFKKYRPPPSESKGEEIIEEIPAPTEIKDQEIMEEEVRVTEEIPPKSRARPE